MMNRFGWMIKAGAFIALMFLVGCAKGESTYQEGMKLAESGKYEEALSKFQQAMKEDGEVSDYHIGCGMAYVHMGKYEDAGKVFENAMDKLKESAAKEEKKQFYYGNALALAGMGEWEQALAYCDKALKIDLLGDMNGDIGYTKAVCLKNQGKYEEAEKVCQKLVKDNKKDWQAYYELASIQEKLGQREEAVKTYEKIREEEKEGGAAHFALYRLYSLMGEKESAEIALDEVLGWDTKKASNALAVGRAHYCKKDRESARKYFQMAYDGSCAEGLYYLGLLSMEERNYQDAEKNFLAYIKEEEKDLDAEVYNQLAVAMMEQEAYEKAWEYLNQGLERGMTGAEQGLLKNQVILYERQGKFEEALEAAREYARRFPEDGEMKKELSFIKTRIK